MSDANIEPIIGLPLRNDRRYTYRDYLQWPEDVRYELIDGEAIMMAPAPALDHQDIAGEMYFQLRQLLEDNPCRAFIAPVDVRLPHGDEADDDIDVVVQPDVLIVCKPEQLDRRGVRGAPAWVAEVISPSTAAHDQIAKRRIYERAGVAEYWLVHPVERTVTIYTLDAGEYGRPDIFELKGSTALQTLPPLSISWDRLVARLPAPEF